MTETRFRALALLLATAVGQGFAAAAAPETRLVIVGGGERPTEAMARFVLWAGGATSRLLVVSWASIEPKGSCDAILGELRLHAPGASTCAPLAPLDAQGKAGRLDAESRARFLLELAASTGVFFTGGDQARIMDVLSDAELLRTLRERHAQGVVDAAGPNELQVTILRPGQSIDLQKP
jgi:cyanophycinase